VLLRLNYCNAVLVGLLVATLAPLQRVLHAAVRLVLDLEPRNHVTHALRELHWLPVMQQIEYKLHLLVHKALIGQAADYISKHHPPAHVGHQHSIMLFTARFQQPRPLSIENRGVNW